MVRANFISAAVAGVALWSACSVSIAQTTIRLPTVRDDTYEYAYILTSMETTGGLYGGSDGDWDTDDSYDGYVSCVASGYHSDPTGYASGTTHGLAYEDFYDTGIPMVFVWGYLDNDTSVDDGDPYEVMGSVGSNFHLLAEADYTIHENSGYSGAGTDESSATIHGGLSLAVQFDYDSDPSVYNTIELQSWLVRNDTNATVGYVTATPLDANATYWSIEGSLGRATSSNPTASPVSADDTLLHGFSETWSATDATSVGSQFWAMASCDGWATITVGTDPSTHEEYPTTSGIDQRSFSAYTYLYVTTVVP